MRTIRVIDTHTGGEPTRVVVAGGPPLGGGSMARRRDVFRKSFDEFRSAIVNEPRGSDAVVGALLCDPEDSRCAAGVIFFNNVGYLNMCGHGTIGVAAALGFMKKIEPGVHQLETPVGTVAFDFDGANAARIDNVPSWRHRADVAVEVPGIGEIRGDIAWGGNWFFLVERHRWDLSLKNVDELTDATWRIRRALNESGITGADGAEIDHIELFGPPRDAGNHSRNFVLCPGKAYDRSPCGTGTSAKLACLFADGKISEGQIWRQESIVGSVFEGTIRRSGNDLIPTIAGSAFVTGEATLLIDPNDPFAAGIRG